MTRQITKAEWTAMQHHGYTSVRNGQRHVLALDKATGATISEPVEVIGMKAPPMGREPLRAAAGR